MGSLGEELSRMYGEMNAIAQEMDAATGPEFAAAMRDAGRKAGSRLATWNAGRGHHPGWVSKKAYDEFLRLVAPFMEELNAALGLPEDYRG